MLSHSKKCSIDKYQCQQCNIQFTTKMMLKEDKSEMHKPEIKFECDRCHRNMPNMKLFKAHRKMCHEKYSCPVCPEEYTFKKNLEKHSQIVCLFVLSMSMSS